MIEARINGNWQIIATDKSNYQRLRLHQLQAPVVTDAVRIVIQATNGDASASIYEVRCY
ncbi:hypothetical protein D3C77_813150 [compost metagenome]